MVLITLLKAILDSGGFAYTEINDTVQMTVSDGSRRWNVVFAADKEGFLRYYARYPMSVSGEHMPALLRELNRLNSTLRAGCFLVADGYPVFRYGAYIFDEFTAAESVADLITVAMAQTSAAWDDIREALYILRRGEPEK